MNNLIYRLLSLIYRKVTPPRIYAKLLGVSIGKNCSIATKGFPREGYLITIGDNVQVTENVCFYTHGGGWVMRQEYPDFDSFGKIVVGNNVYIGNDVKIMPGVTIGNNVIIGTSSVVTKSIPDNVVVTGIPARIVKTIEEYKELNLKYNLNCKRYSYLKKKGYLLSLPDSSFIVK